MFTCFKTFYPVYQDTVGTLIYCILGKTVFIVLIVKGFICFFYYYYYFYLAVTILTVVIFIRHITCSFTVENSQIKRAESKQAH